MEILHRRSDEVIMDILLDNSGDIVLNGSDICLESSVRQDVRIRLLWFFEEWKYAPKFGMPYLEGILIKNPNIVSIEQIFRAEAMKADKVTDVTNITVNIDNQKRTAIIRFTVITDEEIFGEELLLNV